MKKKWKDKLAIFWRGWGCSIVIGLLIALTFRSAIAEFNDVPTGSMKPTILEGDRLFVNKLAYDLKVPFSTWHIVRWGNPARGDIVVFFSPSDGKRLVKRVIGLPGDSIAMENNRLYINGQASEYEHCNAASIDELPDRQKKNHLFYNEDLAGKKHPVMFSKQFSSIHSFGPVTIPEGHYFMMGDNRDNSSDSRFFGFVDRQLIVGRAVGVFFSLKLNHYYLPRWDRFFQGLS
jgi:signal peptidase I